MFSINGTSSMPFSKCTLRDISTKHYEDGTEKLRLDPIPLTEKKLVEIGLDSQVAKAQSAVCRIRKATLDKSMLSAGSGFLISPDGIGITAKHVVDELLFESYYNAKQYADFTLLPGQNIPIKISEGHISNIGVNDYRSRGSNDTKVTVYSVPIIILQKSEKDDLALFALDLPEVNDPWDFMNISDETPQKGDEVYVIGHKGGKRHSYISPGKVLNHPYNFETDNPKQSKKKVINYLLLRLLWIICFKIIWMI